MAQTGCALAQQYAPTETCGTIVARPRRFVRADALPRNASDTTLRETARAAP